MERGLSLGENLRTGYLRCFSVVFLIPFFRPRASQSLEFTVVQGSEKPGVPGKTCVVPGADPQSTPPTPDVDLLLQCTFSYMHNTDEGDGQEEQPLVEQDRFLSSLIAQDDDEEVRFPSPVCHLCVTAWGRELNHVPAVERTCWRTGASQV